MPILRRNEKGEFEEVRYSNPTPEMLILSKLDELKEELDIVSSKLLITEAIPKEQYETRLKADMVAMLTDIQLEIEEKFDDRPFSYNHHQRTEFYRDIDEVIQQKIDSLKEVNYVDKTQQSSL